MSFMLGSAAGAPEQKSGSKVKNKDLAQQYQANSSVKKPQVRTVIWVHLTDSRIPQRITVVGQHPDTASNMYVVRGDELLRQGGMSVASMLSLDPSITFDRRRQ